MTIEPITPATIDEKQALDQAVRETNYTKDMYEISSEQEEKLLRALYDVHTYRLSGKTAQIEELSKIAFGILHECPLKQSSHYQE